MLLEKLINASQFLSKIENIFLCIYKEKLNDGEDVDKEAVLKGLIQEILKKGIFEGKNYSDVEGFVLTMLSKAVLGDSNIPFLIKHNGDNENVHSDNDNESVHSNSDNDSVIMRGDSSRYCYPEELDKVKALFFLGEEDNNNHLAIYDKLFTKKGFSSDFVEGYPAKQSLSLLAFSFIL